MGMIQKFDFARGVADAAAKVEKVRSLPEVSDGTGVIGFCLGGTFAGLMAAVARPDVAVSYYGSGVAGALDETDAVACPLIFHFGDSNPYLPNDQVDATRRISLAAGQASTAATCRRGRRRPAWPPVPAACA